MSVLSPVMNGRCCIVTGATDGIGRVTAERLAQWGASVHLVGRNAEKVAATVAQIGEAAPGAEVHGYVANLSSLDETRRVGAELAAAAPRLDVLVNNAGALYTSRQMRVDGFELTFALNHLGYFLLTALLLPHLQRGTDPRIINVASDAHRRGVLQFEDLQRARSYSGWGAYSQSKLANVAFTYELARRLDGSGISANTLHPGVVATRFAAANGLAGRVMRVAMDLFSISPEQGAATQLYLASSPEVVGVTGKYFDQSRQRASSERSCRVPDQQRLWRESEAMVGMSLL